MLLQNHRLKNSPCLFRTWNQNFKFFSQNPTPAALPSTTAKTSTPWYSVLRTGITSKNLQLGRRAHARIVTSALQFDRFLTNNLINLYSKCGCLSSVRKLFDRMNERDLITWNSVLSTYASSNDSHEIVEGLFLFRIMHRSGILPTKLTFAPVLKLCFLSANLGMSELIHGYAFKIDLDSDIFVASSLLNIYLKLELLPNARKVFLEAPEKDIVMWNMMIHAYAQLGSEFEVSSLFLRLLQSGLQPDSITVQSIIGGRDEKGDSLNNYDQIRGFAIKSCLLQEEDFDTITWNKTMSKLFDSDKIESAMECFVKMKRLNKEYDVVTFVTILNGISESNNLYFGEQIHASVLKAGYITDISVANNFIYMYTKMGRLDCAKKVFKEMEELDIVSWNSMISSYVQTGLEEEAILLFLNLLRTGVIFDQFTLASIIRGCGATTKGLNLCNQVHVHAIKIGQSRDAFVLTGLIDVYAKWGCMEEAEYLFKNMTKFDLATWNAMISGYVTNNDFHRALDLFLLIQSCGELPNHFTLATVLKACSGSISLGKGKQIHAHAIKNGFETDLIVSSGILDMYIKCGNTKDALMVFHRIPEPDEIAWTTMISGCVANGDEDHALSLHHQMRRTKAQPDEYTFATLINACSCITALEQGRQIHANIIKSEQALDSFVGTSLVDMYAKCGNISDSYQLFLKMRSKETASYNAMMVGFAQHGNGEKALNLFRDMKNQGIKPDKITFIGVLSACSHSGLVSEAHYFFESMQNDYGIKPDIEHYSCLVDVLGRSGHLCEAENLINSMPYKASASMYRALLGSCRIKGYTEIGKRVASCLLNLEPLDSSVYVLLSNMYAKANKWDEAMNTRKMMKSKNVKKDPGYSWIEMRNKLHLFVVDDRSHPETDAIYHTIDDIIRRIREEGYVPDTDFALLDVEEEEKERSLYYHSEKLAIAYGLFSSSPTSTIRVIKNLRVCGDCHNAIKYISKVFSREIVLRDANRFHCFRDGNCSCRDYW